MNSKVHSRILIELVKNYFGAPNPGSRKRIIIIIGMVTTQQMNGIIVSRSFVLKIFLEAHKSTRPTTNEGNPNVIHTIII
jgi:hypothetical protein